MEMTTSCSSPGFPPPLIKLLLAIVLCGSSYLAWSQEPLIITSVFDGPLTGGRPKGIEIFALENIPDLSQYGVGSANNGGGSDGQEFTFPSDSLSAGTFFYVASDSLEFHNFFGIPPTYVASATNVNGDDAIELFRNDTIIDLFGDANTDGSGQIWEYTDGWYARKYAAAPSAIFDVSEWIGSGINALDGEVTNASAQSPIPLQAFAHVYNGSAWLGTFDLFGQQASLPDPDGMLTSGLFVQSGSWATAGNFETPDLHISAGASVELLPNAVSTVYNRLLNQGTMALRADSSGYAQLEVGLTGAPGIHVGNPVTLEQYLKDDAGGPKWTHMAFPTRGDLSSLQFDPTALLGWSGGSAGGQNLYYWDESSAMWADPGSSNYIPGSSGMTVYLGSGSYGSFPMTATLEAQLQTTADTAQLSYTGSNPNESGWNFIGNPFSTGIDWASLFQSHYDSLTFPMSSIAKVYNPAAGSYDDIDAFNPIESERIIPPFQGFWIKLMGSPNPNPKDLALKLSDRSTTKTNFRQAIFSQTLQLTATAIDLNAAATVSLSLETNGNPDYDFKDGLYRAGSRWESIGFYFESSDGYALSTQLTRNEELLLSEWPLFFEVWIDTTNSYQIALENDPFQANWKLSLYDQKQSTSHDLRTGPYLFEASSQDSLNRFLLILEKVGLTTPETAKEEYKIINSTSYWKILSTDDSNIMGYELFDALGRRIRSSRGPANVISKQGLANGIYFLEIESIQNQETILIIQKS